MTAFFTTIAAMALAALPSAAPSAETTYTSTAASSPLEVGASFWTRYEMREGYDRLGVSRGRFLEGDWFVYRARLRLMTTALSIGDSQYGARVVFSPQASGFWGDQAGTVATPNLGIYEGFLRVQGPSLRLDIGHFALDYGDALVIGDLRWHQTARSFDGVRLRVGGGLWAEAFLTYLNEGMRAGLDLDPIDPLASTGVTNVFGGDVIFAGVYSSVGSGIGADTTLEPYLLGQIAVGGPDEARPAVQMTLGARALQKVGIFDARLETGVQFGRRRLASGANPEALAWHFDLELGALVTSELRISLEGLYASGDDPETEEIEAWDQLFPTAHKFLGLMDIIGPRANVGSGVVHARYKTGPFIAKLDLHAFFRPETADGQETFAGVEADLNIIYLIMKGMPLRLLYAVFIPGNDHFFTASDESGPTSVADPAHYVEVQFGLQI